MCIFEQSSRDRNERGHMVIPTEYMIIYNVKNHGKKIVHALSYHTEGCIRSDRIQWI